MRITAEFLIVGGIVAFSACTGVFLVREYPTDLWQKPAPAKHLNVGDRLPALRGYQWKSHPATLLLALRVGCPYCEASMDFYEELLKAIPPARTHMLAAYSEAGVTPRGELTSGLRNVDLVTGVDLRGLGVGGTPTVILADSSGTIVKIWRGKLSDALEKDVRDATGVSQ